MDTGSLFPLNNVSACIAIETSPKMKANMQPSHLIWGREAAFPATSKLLQERTLSSKHPHIYTSKRAHKHTHAYPHTHTHTHTHTHVHACAHTRPTSPSKEIFSKQIWYRFRGKMTRQAIPISSQSQRCCAGNKTIQSAHRFSQH